MESDPKFNILLVDDQPSNLLALTAVLERVNQNIVTASSGEEALRRLLENDFALILMDVQMRGMDGFETAALIRQRERTQHTPIMFLTGYERTDVQMFKGYSLGAVDFLTKPIIPEVLRSKVMVFVDLFRKTEQIRQQAEQLREKERDESARQLAEEKHRWEVVKLREEAEREKKTSELIAKKAEELAETVKQRLAAEEQLRARVRQQALVADLGQEALAGIDLRTLMKQAADLVAQSLRVEFSAVFELLDDGETAVLRAGVGWNREDMSEVFLATNQDFQAGAALRLDEPVIVEDLASDPRSVNGDLMSEHGIRSGVTVIIRGRARPFGVLGAHTRSRRSFTVDDVHFLQSIANVLAAAVERKRDEDEISRIRDELATQLAEMTQLHALSTRLSESLELPDLLQESLRSVVSLHGAETGALMLHDKEREELYCAASVGLSGEYLESIARIPLGLGIYGTALVTGEQTILEDIDTDPHFESVRTAAGAAGFRSVCATPLLTQGGVILGVVAVHFAQAHRPTDRQIRLVDLYARQAAQAIDNARLYGEIRDASRGKDEFLAMLAHELRNPLAPMFNSLRIMDRCEDDADLSGRAREVLERQLRHLTRLVDDLLDVSRITRGKIQLLKEPLDLTALIARAVHNARPLCAARGQDLSVAVPEGPIMVDADPTRMEQILANLLNNAIKYTERGGQIWLRVERKPDEVVVRVQDTGIGMTPDMIPRVFELFMQADRSLDRSQGGLGIGLTLVRKLVEMHGGAVQAQSEGPGQGSEFIVRLPVLCDTVGADGESMPVPSRTNLPAVRVLVVDDNRDAAESLSMLLRLSGHEVRMVNDSAAALVAAATYEPDVVLLDIGLPEMDGYQLVSRLRKEPRLTDTLFVAITGYGQDEDRRRSEAAGFHHHLVKPVDFAELQSVLAGCRLDA